MVMVMAEQQEQMKLQLRTFKELHTSRQASQRSSRGTSRSTSGTGALMPVWKPEDQREPPEAMAAPNRHGVPTHQPSAAVLFSLARISEDAVEKVRALFDPGPVHREAACVCVCVAVCVCAGVCVCRRGMIM